MSNNDWNGNYHSIYVTLGASNHTNPPRPYMLRVVGCYVL